MARFPGPVAALAAHFDQVAILPAHSPHKEAAVLGPFVVGEYKPGSYLLLRRNPHYWKRDANGRQLPYLDSIRLDIQQNRELELLRFRRGELDLVNKLDPEMYDRLSKEMPHVGRGRRTVARLGAGVLQSGRQCAACRSTSGAGSGPPNSGAPFRKPSIAMTWCASCTAVMPGRRSGPVSVANRFWLNSALKPPAYSAIRRHWRSSQHAGFHRSGDSLFDRDGHKVEFSMITNAGNKLHERMLALIQQDLAKIGIQLNVVTLDFPSLIERITPQLQLRVGSHGADNVDLDPSDQMNVWLSSARQSPVESESEDARDGLGSRDRQADAGANARRKMRNKRKSYFDKVQQIVADQAPMLFLVNPDALSAVSANVKNVTPARLHPQIFWNAERLSMGSEAREPEMSTLLKRASQSTIPTSREC